MRTVRILAALLAIAGGTALPAALPAAATRTTPAVPVFAYFYQWFTPHSWDRAKIDVPLAGKYSSDDPAVLERQVMLARTAGIDGFLTSWKRTPSLDRRLDLLISAASTERFALGVVYEALDFSRQPLPVSTVKSDLLYLLDTRAEALGTAYFGRPLIIWTGIDNYSLGDVRTVAAALAGRAQLLAASRSVAGFERVADLVAGEAYYWSSADPQSPATGVKLSALSSAVHAHHALWMAPAAPGFNGRTLGGTRVVPRRGGTTLHNSLRNAFASSPDAVGLISWNEWSENTYVEPGARYGSQELDVLSAYLQNRPLSAGGFSDELSGRPSGSGWTGLRASAVLAGIGLLATVLLGLAARRRARRHPLHRRRRYLLSRSRRPERRDIQRPDRRSDRAPR